MSKINASSFFNKGTQHIASQSLRFEDGDNPYLQWTPPTVGSSLTQTLSFWMKRTTAGNYIFRASEFYLYLAGDNLNYYDWRQGANGLILKTSAVYRDVSAWMHVVLTQDRGNATASNRIKLYVNGEQITSFSTATYPNQNEGSYFNNSGNTHYISHPSTNQYDGYLANVTFIDGTALDPTSFGEYDGTLWKPKSDKDIQALTFGTNGFYLPFKQTTKAEGFSTVTYTGTSSQQAIEGVGFKPDFVWIKERDGVSDHGLFDSVRGVGKSLKSNTTASEQTQTDSLTSFDSNGFSLGDNTEAGPDINYTSGSNYVAWCWDAGTGSAASNTDGSITSTVKANTTNGFSIVSYTGSGANATVGHGLSSAPEMILFKKRNVSTSWMVYNQTIGNNRFIYLDLTNGQTGTDSTYFNNTSPTSSVIHLGTYHRNNSSTEPYIAYCFHSVSGYSKISSYSGTGAAGNSITGLGFKPAWLMYKRSDSTGNWIIHDNTRDVDDDKNKRLYPNVSNAEQTVSPHDVTFDSDGFTMNTTGSDGNASGGTYIYMAFKDTRDATFFGDTSGNSNNWTPNALNNTDVVPDSPVTGGNFATYNSTLNTALSLSEGNLEAVYSSAAWRTTSATFYVSSGKWYWETRNTGNDYHMVGIVADSFSNYTNHVGKTADSYSYYNWASSGSAGNKYNNNVVTSYGDQWAAGDIIGIALDLDAGTIEFYKNNVSQGVAFTGISGTYAPAESLWTSSSIANFGQDSSFAGNETPQGNTDYDGVGDFYYAPPSGFLALTTGNLPTPTITAPDDYFNTVLYTGDGVDDHAITGVGFQPDWVWLKTRSIADNHVLNDSVRGGNRQLFSNTTDQEFTATTLLKTFDSDGFTLGTDSAANGNGRTYAAWNWLAGGTAVSNTDGSITSQVSANTDAGFSVVGWNHPNTNPETIGHGLSSAPELIIIKSRDSSIGWFVGTDYLSSGWNQYLILNGTAAQDTALGVYNNTAPTSSVFTLGSYFSTNTANDDMIAYCFHSVEGYSKIGSYTGNGSTDGTYVHCGFRPAWVMVKKTDSVGHWNIIDTARDTHNVADTPVIANLSNAEYTYTFMDVLSNGFKLRNTGGGLNASGGSYIFLAFAEAPFKSANAR